MLTIRAERKDERDEASGQTRRTERQYGVFVRRFQVTSYPASRSKPARSHPSNADSL